MNKNKIKNELPALTGIRAFACLWVLGFHFHGNLGLIFPSIDHLLAVLFAPGHLGVDLFFLLSGFIIAFNYCHKVSPFIFNAYLDFIWARLARLYPVHLATLLACLAFYLGARINHIHINTLATNWGGLDFVANLFMVHAWTNHYLPSWNFPSWSISCEWLAYLTFPAIAALVTCKRSRPFLWMLVALLLGGQLCLHLVHWHGLNWHFSGIAFEFTAGVCFFRIYELQNETGKTIYFPVQSILLILIAIMVVVCSVIKISDVSLIPLLGLFLFYTAINTNSFINRFLSSSVVCYWGRVSYSLYMTHAVTSMLMSRILPLDRYAGHSFTVRLLVCIVYYGFVLVVAMLTYHLVEEPSRWRMRKVNLFKNMFALKAGNN